MNKNRNRAKLDRRRLRRRWARLAKDAEVRLHGPRRPAWQFSVPPPGAVKPAVLGPVPIDYSTLELRTLAHVAAGHKKASVPCTGDACFICKELNR